MAALGVCALLGGCRPEAVTPKTCDTDPRQAALAYADALEAGKLDAAYALTDGQQPKAAFEKTYATAEARKARAKEVRASADTLHAEAGELALTHTEGWRIAEPTTVSPREVLERFLAAADKGDFNAAYALLAGSWRAQYTPERLKKDFEAEPLAKERLARAREALQSEPVQKADAVEFPIGGGRAVRLVREGGSYRVAGLE